MSSRHARILAAAFVGAALVGCGGGGGGGGGGSAAPAPSAPAPTGTVTLTPKGPVTAAATVGEPITAVLEGTWQASGVGATASVYLKVVDLAGTLQSPPVALAPGNGTFRYELAPKSELRTGNHANQLEITACRDAGCAQTYGPGVRVDYRIAIATLGEWETFNRDARHANYVATSIDPTRLREVWEWRSPAVSGAIEVFVGRPATTDGSLVALAGGNMADGTQRDLAMYQLDESTGAVRWKRPVPDGASAVSPATNGQLAYLSTVGTDTLHTAIDASGTTVFTYAQNTQPQAWTLAPSHFDGTLYFFGGNNGDEVHAANSTTGQRIWTRPRVGLQSSTPTIDSKHVYYLAGGTIQILDRLTGNTVGSIADTSSDGTASPGSHTIALGTQGNLIAHSYRQMRGPRLSSFDIASRSVNWTTTATYNQFYAVADGVIYATRNASSTPAGLDAIDEKTGQVLWTWALPNADQQDRFIGNLVATRDAVFFGSYSSTSQASFVWAIDVRKRESVWRYAEAGHVVISGNRTVYIVSGPGGLLSTRVRALRLQ